MALTLPQRLYLLSYDIDKNRFDPLSAAYRGQLLRSAALVELTIGGHLRVRNGTATRTVVRPPADTFLAEVLADVSPAKPTHWIHAVLDRTGKAGSTVRDQLAADGSITVSRGRVLRVFPVRRITLDHPEQVRLLRERTRDAVLAGRDPETVPVEDAALAVIAADGDVWTVFDPAERVDRRAAFDALRERVDAVVPGLRLAILTTIMAGTGRVPAN